MAKGRKAGIVQKRPFLEKVPSLPLRVVLEASGAAELAGLQPRDAPAVELVVP